MKEVSFWFVAHPYIVEIRFRDKKTQKCFSRCCCVFFLGGGKFKTVWNNILRIYP